MSDPGDTPYPELLAKIRAAIAVAHEKIVLPVNRDHLPSIGGGVTGQWYDERGVPGQMICMWCGGMRVKRDAVFCMTCERTSAKRGRGRMTLPVSVDACRWCGGPKNKTTAPLCNPCNASRVAGANI